MSSEQSKFPSGPAVFSLWLLTLPLLMIGIGTPEVSRTQEARVLETARQMLGKPLRDWLIPKLNGDLRLQKPPLTYWLTAAAFRIGGVREGVGRMPNAIAGWLTLAVVYCAARGLFGGLAGQLSATCLLGSYYFARHIRLAETDALATLFITLSIYALWRGAADPAHQTARIDDYPASAANRERPAGANSFQWMVWMQVGGFTMGMSILAKGAVGLFPALFLAGLPWVARSGVQPLRRFAVSGAWLTMLVIALPWFAYVAHHHGLDTFIRELRNTEEGGDHAGSVVQYIPWYLIGAAPWSLFALAGLWHAIQQRSDWRMRGLLLWFAAIAIPLGLNGNKQSHYLIPLLPVSMMLAGRFLQTQRWIRPRTVFIATTVFAIALPSFVTLGIPKISPGNTRETARLIKEQFGNEDLICYGANQSVPLCFNLRKEIPFAMNESELESDITRRNWAVVFTVGKDKRPAPEPPASIFVKRSEMQRGDQVWRFYCHRIP